MWGSITVLGNAAQGCFEHQLTRCYAGAIPTATEKRMAQAEALARHLCAMTKLPLKRAANRVVWYILGRVLNTALDFDASVIPHEAMASLVPRFDASTSSVLLALLVTDHTTDMQMAQACLPITRGGFGLTRLEDKIAIAPLVSGGQALQQLQLNLDNDISVEQRVNATQPIVSAAGWSLAQLWERGVVVLPSGSVVPWEGLAPETGILQPHLIGSMEQPPTSAVLLAAIAGAKQAQLLLAGSKRDRARLRSCGGILGDAGLELRQRHGSPNSPTWSGQLQCGGGSACECTEKAPFVHTGPGAATRVPLHWTRTGTTARAVMSAPC